MTLGGFVDEQRGDWPVRSRSTVHLPEDALVARKRYAPDWADAMPEPPGVAPGDPHRRDEPRGTHPAVRWIRGLVLSLLLGALGVVLYVSLAIVTGHEIYPAVIVTGILCGAGLRLAGVRVGVVAGTVSMVFATAFLWLSGALAQACLTAMAGSGNLSAALAPWSENPVAASAGLFEGPVLAALLVVLAASGAVLATIAYGDRDAAPRF